MRPSSGSNRGLSSPRSTVPKRPIAEVLKGIAGIEMMFRHDAECTDDSQRAAVFAVES